MVTGHRLWRGNWQSLGHKEVGNWEALGVWAQQPGEAGLLLGVEAAGSQSSERPLDPAGEMGMRWLDRCTWSGRGSRLEMSLESLQEEERPGGGMWITADSTRWLWCRPGGINSEPERAGCQELSFSLCCYKTPCQSLKPY